ncbi:hypothetical protein SanaruYs_37020 [Chryseotalea sanaruensis]|uniref:Uncharacterized protein n=1 Tax=Chryseotalea sanaruensis TaxID=2482724 RepID=A0A401UEX6_9BACT|nr:hypothetical protein [Chryseotalea sanaruensis]GCC53458.1 hypothetical protein SanaruYs_37020 [Chryseotalea sanaruensis]
MEYATFDESDFPIVRVTFNIKNPTLDQFKQFIDGQKKLLSYLKPFVLIMDARNVGFLSSEIRIEQGTFFKNDRERLNKYCIGAVLWVSSPIVSMMIKGMMLIEKPPNETFITSNIDEVNRKVEELRFQIMKSA